MAKTRSIFEDVSSDKKTDKTPVTGGLSGPPASARRAVALWLTALLVLVIAMVIVGGLTRLTDSGLSITEWNLVKGTLPPLSEVDWVKAFGKYQNSPEYLLQNKGMELSAFKVIYWWEWSHRQLGRFIGLVWGLGFLWFLMRREIPRGWVPRLLGIGFLGGLQGAIGWWMVASGLSGRVVDVASYRLAVHLGLAFVIAGFLMWFIWLLNRQDMDLFKARREKDVTLVRYSNILLIIVLLQTLLGALVAGIDAGRGYIDWPLMGGEFLPSESFDYTPLWTNVFENPALVQFNHRMLGYVVLVASGVVWWVSRRTGQRATKSAFDRVMILILGQVVLGIVTIIYAVPWQSAILHQILALAVFGVILRARFFSLYPPAQKL